MINAVELKTAKLPKLVTELPGTKAKEIVDQDAKYISPSYTRPYPLVIKRAKGAMIEDVDGNIFLDFNAGSPSARRAIRTRRSLKRSRSRWKISSTSARLIITTRNCPRWLKS